LTFQEYINLAC